MPKATSSNTSKLLSFRDATCGSCSLRTLCLPLSLEFSDLDALESIINRGRPLKKGDHLFRQGDKLGAIYALRSGCVRTYMVSDDGNEQTTGFYLPSELLGLSSIDSKIYPVSAVAIETTSVCEIPYSQLDTLTSEIPGLKHQLISLMSKEMRNDLHMMMTLSQKSADERVADFIMDLSTRIQRRGYAADFIYLTMSRTDIANYLGLAVETVSRVFSRLQKSGVISVDGRVVKVNDTRQLAQAAGTCMFANDKDCGADRQKTI